MAAELSSTRNKRLHSGAPNRRLHVDASQFLLRKGSPLALHGWGPRTNMPTALWEAATFTDAGRQLWNTHVQLFRAGQEWRPWGGDENKGVSEHIWNSVTTAGLGSIEAHQNMNSQKCHKLNKMPAKAASEIQKLLGIFCDTHFTVQGNVRNSPRHGRTSWPRPTVLLISVNGH